MSRHGFTAQHEASTEWAAARNIARALTTWQILDMNLIANQGFMRVTSQRPKGLTGKLLDWRVCIHKNSEFGWVLVKGPRWDAVVKARNELAALENA